VPNSTRELFRSEEGRVRLVDTFVKDAQFVLDQVSRLPRKDASDVLAGHIQLDKVAYIGHLLGGTAAAEGALRDPRIIAGISMSGLLEGPAWQRGLSKPFLVFRSAVVPPEQYTDEQIEMVGMSRDSLTRRFADQDRRLGLLLRNGGTEIRMDGAASMSFSDYPLWSPFFARRYKMAGPDEPADVHWAVTSLTLRFLNQYLKGNDNSNKVMLPPNVQMRVIPHRARE
jgi:pimeloyl-ACP methyl ester carboxylesterase